MLLVERDEAHWGRRGDACLLLLLLHPLELLGEGGKHEALDSEELGGEAGLQWLRLLLGGHRPRPLALLELFVLVRHVLPLARLPLVALLFVNFVAHCLLF